ncbi:MAG: two-component sensor histidine kinase, partial [Deltaproteobacteria bacterium]|nr:two-component sensor histidine kinase [Deltaproteobacteria bacterium]
MRSGLRSQLLLLIGVVLVAGFVPLHFAVSTYSRLALRDARVAGARALGRAIGGQVAEARAR